MGVGERQRAEHKGVNDAEDGDVGSDGQRQNEYGDDGEAGIAAKGAQRVFQVLGKNVEIHKATCLPLLFSCLLNAAECEDGATASLFWRHAALDVVFDGEVDVGSQLGIEFFIKAFAGEEGAHAAERSFEPGTHRNSVLRRLS